MSSSSFFSKAIIIGAGPIIWETKVLDIISHSKFKGLLVIPDRMIYYCILKNIIPRRFQIVTACQEYFNPKTKDKVLQNFKNYFSSVLIDKYCKGMEMIIACTVDPELYDLIESKGFYIKKVHRFGKVCELKNIENISIDGGGNIGMFCHQVARILFGIRNIGTVGLEFTISKHDTNRIDNENKEWEPELTLSKNIIAQEFFGEGLTTYNLNGIKPIGRFYGKGIKAMELTDFIN